MGLIVSKDFYKEPDLIELIAEFSEKAKRENPIWCSKFVRINFVFNDKEYEIVAKDLEVSDEQFECVQREMANRIRKLGATHIICDGFLD